MSTAPVEPAAAERRRRLDRMEGTGELRAELRAERTRCDKAERSLEALQASHASLAAEHKQVTAEAAAAGEALGKMTKEIQVVLNSSVFRAMLQIEDHCKGKPELQRYAHTFQNLADSVLDGKLPLDSCMFEKIMTAAANMRESSTNRFRFLDSQKLLASMALNCDGARQALIALRGPGNIRRHGSMKFDGVEQARLNDTSIASVTTVRAYLKDVGETPAFGVNHQQIKLLAGWLRQAGVVLTPPLPVAELTETAEIYWSCASVVLVSSYHHDAVYGYTAAAGEVVPLTVARRELLGRATQWGLEQPWEAVKAWCEHDRLRLSLGNEDQYTVIGRASRAAAAQGNHLSLAAEFEHGGVEVVFLVVAHDCTLSRRRLVREPMAKLAPGHLQELCELFQDQLRARFTVEGDRAARREAPLVRIAFDGTQIHARAGTEWNDTTHLAEFFNDQPADSALSDGVDPAELNTTFNRVFSAFHR